MNMDGQELAKQVLDQIPQTNSNARHIVGLIKKGGKITGYQLSDESFVSKPEAVSMAKQGQIAGVGIAHRGDTEYLKSIPDGSENNNLGSLPFCFPPIINPGSLFFIYSNSFLIRQGLSSDAVRNSFGLNRI